MNKVRFTHYFIAKKKYSPLNTTTPYQTMNDGSFSYVHLSNPNIATYIETWRNEPLPFDDIEPPQINTTKNNIATTTRNGRDLPLLLNNDDEDLLQGAQVFGAGVGRGL